MSDDKDVTFEPRSLSELYGYVRAMRESQDDTPVPVDVDSIELSYNFE